MSYQKMTVSLSDEVMGAAHELAAEKSISLTEILRRSISARVFLEEAQREGKAVLLRDPNTKETHQIYFE